MFRSIWRACLRFDAKCSSLASPVIDFVAPEPADTDSSDIFPCYRETEKNRIVEVVKTGSSLLVVGESGAGKTTLADFVAADLRASGLAVAEVSPATAKQALLDLAEQLGLEAKGTAAQLQTAIESELERSRWLLTFDDAHRLSVAQRVWLERLHARGQSLLLLATYPPARDIFLKLPRIELRPLGTKEIRALMVRQARELDIELPVSALASLQQRTGGNPMLARRVVREEYLGLESSSPDHTQWIDGTPFLIACLLVFSVIRFIGRGLGQTDLYLMGGVLMVFIAIMRLLIMSLPRKNQRLGR